MSDFSKIELLRGAAVLEERSFPLFGLTGLYQKIWVAEKGIGCECVVVDLREAGDHSEEQLLNLIIASGLVDEHSDLTFMRRKHYFYSYFHFCER